jgi:hypothetical protein
MGIKDKVRHVLERRSYHELIELNKKGKSVFRCLVSLSFDKTDLLAWRAIEAMGIFCKETAQNNPEETMHMVRKLLWYLSEETGGIAWSAPEMLGEIVRHNPKLTAHIAPIVTHLDEPPFRRGVVWATGRIGELYPEMVSEVIPDIIEETKNQDPVIRGLAAQTLGLVKAREALMALDTLIDDSAVIRCYIDGELVDKTVGELARQASQIACYSMTNN